MKAAVLHAVNDLRVEQVETPRPGRGEVLLKIKAAGICGSDLDRIYKKGTYSFPTIPGHEFAGEIVEVGEGVEKDLLHRSAAVFPLLPCRQCDMCETGEYASCRHYNYFGSRCDGGFAEYIAVQKWNLVLGNGELDYVEMAMAEPAAVSLHALNQAGVETGDNVAVFGAGAIGLMLASFAIIGGAQRVILLDVDGHKIDFARKVGFPDAMSNAEEGWMEKIMELTSGTGVDIAVEGAGVSPALAGCLCAAKPLGKVVLMGNPSGDMALSQKDYWEILRKQLTVKGTWNSSYTQKKNEWRIAIRAMASGRLNVKPFVTHVFGLDKINHAFEVAADKDTFSNRVMITMD